MELSECYTLYELIKSHHGNRGGSQRVATVKKNSAFLELVKLFPKSIMSTCWISAIRKSKYGLVKSRFKIGCQAPTR